MTSATSWLSVSERGSLFWMRLAVWTYRLVGRRVGAWMILPVVAYFFLTDRKGRKASSRYLRRVYACPRGRAALGREPRIRDCFTHYREFALAILDRFSFWLGNPDRIAIHLHGRNHFDALREKKRGDRKSTRLNSSHT